MSSETLFYVLGIALTVCALVVSFVGLRSEERFPSSAAMRLTVLLFAVLVAGTATFGVVNAREEQEHRNAELAAEEHAAETEAPAEGTEAGAAPAGGEPAGAEPAGGSGGGQPEAQGPGGTLKLTASTTALAYDKKQLSSKPGEVTVDFDNPAQVEHDVAIEQGGQEVAKTELVAEGKTSTSAELAPGSYTFFCTVPGHREGGMEGTLTVK